MIDVVGMPAEGPDGLSAALRERVCQARTLVGSTRLLGLVPPVAGQTRRPWPSPMLPALPGLLAEVGTADVVVLATGDPLLSGVGTTLVRLLGPEAVRVHPAVSSVVLARARMGWSAEETVVVSLVSAPPAALVPHIAPGARIVALSAGARTPERVAATLVEAGCGRAALTVLGDLGASGESRACWTAEELLATAPSQDGPALNVVAVEIPSDARAAGTSPGLPDEAFEHDGQLTKRELRALALAALRPLPGRLLWDLGAGAGSVGIEWALHDPRCRTVAVERSAERADRIGRNALALGAVHVDVVRADVLDALPGLARPDAVFVGGGAGGPLLDAAWAALHPGGRLVAHAVTLETEQLLHAAYGQHGGALTRVSVERAEPLGRHLSWTPARPVVQWAVTKEGGS